MPDILTFDNWRENLIDERADYMDVLKWAFQEYGDDIIYACSFGAEGIVLIDLIYKVNKHAKVRFLDTNLHFIETYKLIQQVKERYPTLDIRKVQPTLSLKEQASIYGRELWRHDPNLCCHLRKVEPLKETLNDVKAWISGLRREQSQSRKETNYINRDEKFKKVKICPLIHWTWEDIIQYIQLHQLPYNPLHDQGYPSIGCAPCTEPVEYNSDFRAGRWKGFSKTECGLHQN